MNSKLSHGYDDQREALFNEGSVGPVTEIQFPVERVTTLHGIVFDIDPGLYVPDNPLFPPAADPATFYAQIRPVLERHPLVRSAEVRSSGTGIHLLLHLQPAMELLTAGEQRYWSEVVRAVQCTLPIDPNMPGITALTRPVGSVNSKNGAVVSRLKAGEPVTPQEVEAYLARVVEARFREVARPLLGADRVSPCPVCRGEGTRLDVLDHVGMCYGRCSRVTIQDLYDCIFLPPAAKTPKCNTVAVKSVAGTASGQGTSDPVACSGDVNASD
jgi:hypothetical protein